MEPVDQIYGILHRSRVRTFKNKRPVVHQRDHVKNPPRSGDATDGTECWLRLPAEPDIVRYLRERVQTPPGRSGTPEPPLGYRNPLPGNALRHQTPTRG